MRLIILFLLLAPFAVFSQTQTDTLSITVIVPKSVSPTIEIVQGIIIERFEPMENVPSYPDEYRRVGCVEIPYKHIPVGLFEHIDTPTKLWFYLDLIAIRD